MARTARIWTPETLLAERTVEVGECHEWQGSFGGGQGRSPQINTGGHCTNVRRLVYALARGKRPQELAPEVNVWASCGNWRCVSPKHLCAGSRADMCAALAQHQVYRRTPTTVLRITATKRRTQAKLTLSQAREIRAAEGKLRDIAAQHGVSASLVSLIKRGRTWREAPGRHGLDLQAVWGRAA